MFKEYKLLIKGNMINNIGCFVVALFLLLVVSGFLVKEIVKDVKIDSQIEAHNIKENCKKDKNDNKVCSPVFYYMVDEKEYVCGNLGTFEQRELLNKTTVYYASSDPNICDTDLKSVSMGVMLIVFLIVLIIFVVTLVLMLKAVKHYRKFEKISSGKCKLHRGVVCKTNTKRKYLFGLGAYYYEADINTKNGVKHCVSNRYLVLDDEIKRIDILVSEEDPNLYIVDFCIF